jgi:beta-galactosidase
MFYVLKDGKAGDVKNLPPIHLAAGRDTIINISQYLPEIKPGAEYIANIVFLTRESTAWASRNLEIASNEFALTGPVLNRPLHQRTSPASILNEKEAYIVKGKGFEIRFDKSTGALSSYLLNGKEQIIQPLMPNFKRPLTDNDRRGWKPQIKLKQWYSAVPKLIDVGINKRDGKDMIMAKYSLIHDSAQVMVYYYVASNGAVEVDYTLHADPALPNIPKIGMQCGIRRECDSISWYGRGLLENYIDRNAGFPVGTYIQSIYDFMEPYVVPQENGNRTDVRWMFLFDKKSEGLLVVADSLLSMSAWPYTEANIENAKHTIDLKDAGYITLNIDLIQMGVGGNDSWSDVAAPLEIYRIPSGTYHYSFHIMPWKTAPSKYPVYGRPNLEAMSLKYKQTKVDIKF